MSILIEADTDHPAAYADLIIDIRDEHLAGGVFGSYQARLSFGQLLAERWYYGFWMRDAGGVHAFELRATDAGFPTTPHWRLVTALRSGANGSMMPRYRQIGDVITYDGDYEIALGLHLENNTAPYDITFQPQPNNNIGAASLIPKDIALTYFLRPEVANKNTNGIGLAQASFMMLPTTADGAFQKTCKAYAGTEQRGDIHAHDDLECHHRPGDSQLHLRMPSTSIVNILYCGHRIRMLTSHGPIGL